MNIHLPHGPTSFRSRAKNTVCLNGDIYGTWGLCSPLTQSFGCRRRLGSIFILFGEPSKFFTRVFQGQNKKSMPKATRKRKARKNSITKKPISRKPLAKYERMCYNILRVPVIRLYRSALLTSIQGCRIAVRQPAFLFVMLLYRNCRYLSIRFLNLTGR